MAKAALRPNIYDIYIQYLKRIYYNTFKFKNLIKLIYIIINHNINKIKEKNDIVTKIVKIR